jgi:hypothetical protein
MIVYTVTIAVNAHAQGGFLKKMTNRAEQAATNKAGNAVEKGVNEASDKVLNGGKPATGAASDWKHIPDLISLPVISCCSPKIFRRMWWVNLPCTGIRTIKEKWYP